MSMATPVLRTFTPRETRRRRASCAGAHRATTTELRDALASLLAGGQLPASVRLQIGASWRRAIESGLQPDRIAPPYDPDIESDGLLVRAARPVLDQLAVDLSGSDVAVLLTNDRGQVVDRRVPEPALAAYLDGIGLAPGYVYAEDAVGTNGMGTALAEGSPCTVRGDEHFSDALTSVACAGAPISDPRSGRTFGVIDLTCLSGDASSLMLPLATRAAHDIEERLVDDGRVSERLVLQRFLQERRRAKGPLVLITERAMITNAAADRLIEPHDELLLRECANRLSGAEHGRAEELTLTGGAHVAVRATPMFDESPAEGAILRLTPVAEHAPTSGTHRGSAAFGWESLTPTELSVIALVAQGLTNREAAERLFLSHHTVGFHLRSIYRKLGVNSRVEVTRLAVEHGSPTTARARS